jgi:uncharacterized membrane protein (DUF485 family)
MTTVTARVIEDDAAQAALAKAMMRRQAALSIRVAAVFLVLIFGLPIVNWLLPQVAEASVGGFTLTWLLLGVLFYPITWLLSGYFIRESDRIEAQIAAEYPHAAGKEAAR